jgi:hypothetical protein
MTWIRDGLRRMMTQSSGSVADDRATHIYPAEFKRNAPGTIVTELTEEEIRSNEGESWQPPPPARRDPRRPQSGFGPR